MFRPTRLDPDLERDGIPVPALEYYPGSGRIADHWTIMGRTIISHVIMRLSDPIYSASNSYSASPPDNSHRERPAGQCPNRYFDYQPNIFQGNTPLRYRAVRITLGPSAPASL